MVSVVILDGGEPNVIQLTFENLYSELKDIYGAELLVRDKWFDLDGINNRCVCFVEPDCLVSKGYFKSLLTDFKGRGGFSQVTAVMSGATAVNYWDNKIYGYKVGAEIQGILPNREKKSTSHFPVQVAYIPGAIMRTSMLRTALEELNPNNLSADLVYMSSELSLEFWRKGYRVNLNPRATYLTTEDYVNDIGDFGIPASQNLVTMFKRESI